jgi:hypothetical protein
MDRSAVGQWVADYERVWRTPGTEQLAELFTGDASYQMSPWEEPFVGLEAIARLWEAERDGPDETFTMASEVVAVDGATAVVRVTVDYAGRDGTIWRDLWVLRFAEDGRCAAFEEWPFAPAHPDGH